MVRTGQAIKELIDSRVANNPSSLTIEWYDPVKMTLTNGRRA